MTETRFSIELDRGDRISATWGDKLYFSVWGRQAHVSTFLTRQQAKALAEALTEWADQPHYSPKAQTGP